jgi:hypothetical protein
VKEEYFTLQASHLTLINNGGAKMETNATESSLLSDLNTVRVKAEDLSKVLAAVRRAPKGGETNHWTGILTTMRLFNDSPEEAKAIIFRLQALARIIANDELGDWILGYGTSIMPVIALNAMVSAAADHPLSLINGDVLFEKESFLRRVLECAEPQGLSI